MVLHREHCTKEPGLYRKREKLLRTFEVKEVLQAASSDDSVKNRLTRSGVVALRSFRTCDKGRR